MPGVILRAMQTKAFPPVPDHGFGLSQNPMMSAMRIFQQLFGSGGYQYDVARMPLRAKLTSCGFAISATFSIRIAVLTCLLATATPPQNVL